LRETKVTEVFVQRYGAVATPLQRVATTDSIPAESIACDLPPIGVPVAG